MNLYEIALPDKPNGPVNEWGGYAIERVMWEDAAIDAAGGLTRLGKREGMWRSDAGQLFIETMHWYQVAVEDDQIIADLVEKAGELFPDQLAFFVAKIGTAENVSVSMAKNFAEAAG